MYPVDIRQIKTLTPPRLINAGKVYLSYLYSRITGKAVVKGYPVVLSIEPTSLCNLKCPQCPTGMEALKRDSGYMNMDLYRSILDGLAKYITTIQLYFQGEPFMNKLLPEMITYAKSRNIYTITSTNGHFLTDENIGKIINAGLDALIIGLDGVSEESYSKYRKNGKFDTVISGIERLVDEKRKNSAGIPKIYLQFLVLKGNEDQIEEIRKLGKKLQVDRVLIKTAQVYPDTDTRDLLPSNPDYSRYTEKNCELVLKNSIPDHCKRIWTTAVFTWDGILASCCFDKDAGHSFGIWNGAPFDVLWRGEKAMRFRQQVLENRKTVAICRNCTEGLKEFK
ncbi:radical SAM/SPASM domain-containing protein [candidate division KSB1 bacterium]